MKLAKIPYTVFLRAMCTVKSIRHLHRGEVGEVVNINIHELTTEHTVLPSSHGLSGLLWLWIVKKRNCYWSYCFKTFVNTSITTNCQLWLSLPLFYCKVLSNQLGYIALDVSSLNQFAPWPCLACFTLGTPISGCYTPTSTLGRSRSGCFKPTSILWTSRSGPRGMLSVFAY